MFNKRKTKWILKSAAFDFIIKHRSKKSNFMNALFQHFEYQNINGEMQNLLSILQQKLSKIELINVCTSEMQLACVVISQFFNFNQIEKNTFSNFLKQKKLKIWYNMYFTSLLLHWLKKNFFLKIFFLIIEMIKTLHLKNEFITIHKFEIETSWNQISDLSSSWRFDNDVFKFKKKSTFLKIKLFVLSF